MAPVQRSIQQRVRILEENQKSLTALVEGLLLTLSMSGKLLPVSLARAKEFF